MVLKFVAHVAEKKKSRCRVRENRRTRTCENKLEPQGQLETHVHLSESLTLMMWVTCRGSWCTSPCAPYASCSGCGEAEGDDLAGETVGQDLEKVA